MSQSNDQHEAILHLPCIERIQAFQSLCKWMMQAGFKAPHASRVLISVSVICCVCNR